MSDKQSSTISCPDCKGNGEQYYRLGNTECLVKCDNCAGTGKLGPESPFYEWALGYWQERGQ